MNVIGCKLKLTDCVKHFVSVRSINPTVWSLRLLLNGCIASLNFKIQFVRSLTSGVANTN